MTEGTKPVGAFVYDASYLARADALPLDHGQLKLLKRRPLKATRNEGLYDLFKDVKPEGFGLHILTRKHSRSSITNLEALEFAQGDTVGGTVLRTHFASAATVMGTDKAVAGTRTYPMLAQYASRWLVPDFKDELWRRIAFNVLIGNGDDHARNHGFLLGPKGWELSPAYDIAPYMPSGGKVHPVKALSIGLLRSGEARATADVLLLCAKELDVDYEYANNYLDATYALIREQWDSLAEAVGQKPLQQPLFELPPRAARLSKAAVAAHRHGGR